MTSFKDPSSPLTNVLFSKISSRSVLSSSNGEAVKSACKGARIEPFCRVLALLRVDGVERGDARRVKDWDLWGVVGRSEIEVSISRIQGFRERRRSTSSTEF